MYYLDNYGLFRFRRRIYVPPNQEIHKLALKEEHNTIKSFVVILFPFLSMNEMMCFTSKSAI